MSDMVLWYVYKYSQKGYILLFVSVKNSNWMKFLLWPTCYCKHVWGQQTQGRDATDLMQPQTTYLPCFGTIIEVNWLSSPCPRMRSLTIYSAGTSYMMYYSWYEVGARDSALFLHCQGNMHVNVKRRCITHLVFPLSPCYGMYLLNECYHSLLTSLFLQGALYVYAMWTVQCIRQLRRKSILLGALLFAQTCFDGKNNGNSRIYLGI